MVLDEEKVYEIFENFEESKDQLSEYLCAELALPSGRKGNILALAIDLKKFGVAEYIVLNDFVRIDEVSYDENYKNKKSAIDHVIEGMFKSKEKDRENLYELLLILSEKNREMIRSRKK